jgi:hypothetical protein
LVAVTAVLKKDRCGMPSNAAYRMFKCVYLLFAVLFWPVTTLVSTGYALALKLPPLRLRALRLPAIRSPIRPRTPVAPDS